MLTDCTAVTATIRPIRRCTRATLRYVFTIAFGIAEIASSWSRRVACDA